MNAQEQRFYEYGLLHARILRNSKDLALAKRIAIDHAATVRQLAESPYKEKDSEGFSECLSTSCKDSGDGEECGPFPSFVNSKTIGELQSVIEYLEKEGRELHGSMNMREDLILDEYERLLRGESTQK